MSRAQVPRRPLRPDRPSALVGAAVTTLDPAVRIHSQLITGSLDAPDLDDVEVDGCRAERLRVIGGRIGRLAVMDVEAVGCDLSGVELPDVTWERVQLIDCRLAGCAGTSALWRDVELRDVRAPRLALRYATLRRVVLADCDLTGVDVTGATFDGVTLQRCALGDAELSGLTVRRAHLEGCDLAGARGVEALRGATVDASTLTSLAGPMSAVLGIRPVR